MVMHYNKGWADGYHYNIQYWEIWNEPDFLPFWRGTAAQYHELYKKCARAIRQPTAPSRSAARPTPLTTTRPASRIVPEVRRRPTTCRSISTPTTSTPTSRSTRMTTRVGPRTTATARQLRIHQGRNGQLRVRTVARWNQADRRCCGPSGIHGRGADVHAGSPVDQVYSLHDDPAEANQHGPEVAPPRRTRPLAWCRP